MSKLILVRHGQSAWNLQNRFTGWIDVPLTPTGEEEAMYAGELLLRHTLKYDAAFVSVLKRAIKTLHLLSESAGLQWVEESRSWRLNERHYGALQGLDKGETAKKYGKEQVRIWRRSYDVRPPLLSPDAPSAPQLDPIYAGINPDELPLGESLKDCIARVRPFWERGIVPLLKESADVLIVAHGNSLRGICMMLENISPQKIPDLEIPTGRPLIYELDKNLAVENRLFLE